MEKPKYDHQKIEKKWQEYWETHGIFYAEMDEEKPKYYVLDMFPYPSGDGLHVGHALGYTATDILARYKRQKGFNVLHPMGWDSFGLPAEQYAIRTGTHPAVTTEKNVKNFKRQLKMLGYSYDWSREIMTSDPKYYKWTQWIFTKLYEKGLAYEAEMNVNYCPQLGTVLANEEIEDGKSKVGGFPVERRPLRQWVLKITAYADQLIDDLNDLDWPESLKRHQINWVGRSVGATVDFVEKETNEKITVFTTRAETLFGASYLVLAPEHPFVHKITTREYKRAVYEYCLRANKKTDLERTELSKEKTGVWTGAYGINPVNDELLPIWISDYVLMGYGTGAVMAVPAHDERDFEFANKFELPIKPVVDPQNDDREAIIAGELCSGGDGVNFNSEGHFSLNGQKTKEAKKTAVAWLRKNGKGKKAINYKLRDWLFSRQRYWGEPFPILHFEDGSRRALELDELPLLPPEITNFHPSKEGLSPLAAAKEWVEVIDPKTGKKAFREINTMPQWAGSCWYYLRFVDPHNDHIAWDGKKEKYWLPVDMYIGGAEHAVLHLLYARFWHKVLYDCGIVSTNEPFKSLRNQGLITALSFQKSSGEYVLAEDVEKREDKYFHRETDEELRFQVEKMSKSKLNGISPDEIIDEFGADALRLYEMFMGPLEKEKLWNTDAVGGCKRFLSRFCDIAFSDKISEETSEEALKLGCKLVDGVEKDIEGMRFNTAIAKMMEFVNAFSRLEKYPKQVVKMATQALYPFAPHIAEEIWEYWGGEDLAYTPYPIIDPKYLEEDTVTYIVQVNGKLRARLDLPKDQTKETILNLAKEHPNVSKFIAADIKKAIFVPNKLLNIVV